MISVVIPVYNEEKNVKELHERLFSVLKKTGKGFEIIFVDDGSRDRTFEELKKLKPVKAIRFARNLGQSAAFGCGIKEAKGGVIVTMDGDLENQPEDIPSLLRKLSEGFDVVSGWRKGRWGDQKFTRRLPSLAANRLISGMTGVNLHDHGCNLRVYKKEVFENVSFFGEMHRMLAAYLGMRGAKIAEIPVSFSPRKHGKSKYGLSRTFKVLLDLLAFYFFREYSSRPMHFFGYAGFTSIFLGFLTFLWALALRFFEGTHFNRTPLPVLVAIFVVVGFQFMLMGLLAEIFVGLRQQEREQKYDVKEVIEN